MDFKKHSDMHKGKKINLKTNNTDKMFDSGSP